MLLAARMKSFRRDRPHTNDVPSIEQMKFYQLKLQNMQLCQVDNPLNAALEAYGFVDILA